MKRLLIAVMITTLAFGVNVCFAQSNGKDKITTSLTIKNDFGFPKDGEDYTTQAISAYWHYKWLGGGIDLRANFRNDFLEASPYLTLNYAHWYLLGGCVVDSEGSDFIQVGLWYINTIGKFNVVLDLRNYWPVDGKNLNSYTDDFLEVTYPLSDRFFVGIDLEYAHWWEGPSHDYLSVGPLVGYKISKNVSIFVRPTYDWNFADKTTGTTRVRVGLSLSF